MRTVANADGWKPIGRLQSMPGRDAWFDGGEVRRWRRRRCGVREAEAALVVRGRRGRRVLARLLLGAATKDGPQRRRRTVAHQRGMDERLQEIDGDGEQRHGKADGPQRRVASISPHAGIVARSVPAINTARER